MMELMDGARFTFLGETRWCRELGNTDMSDPMFRMSIDVFTLLGFCTPDSSIVLVAAESKKQMSELYQSLFLNSCLTPNQQRLGCFELVGPTLDTLMSTMVGLTNEKEEGWICVENVYVAGKSLCLLTRPHKRPPRRGMPKKVDDLVLDLARVWGLRMNPNDPRLLKMLSDGVTYLTLYGHRTPHIETFNYHNCDKLVERLFDLSLTHYVKYISSRPNSHSVYLNLAPCYENGGQTNIDANFIDLVSKCIRSESWFS